MFSSRTGLKLMVQGDTTPGRVLGNKTHAEYDGVFETASFRSVDESKPGRGEISSIDWVAIIKDLAQQMNKIRGISID
jgi:hypothetical protein